MKLRQTLLATAVLGLMSTGASAFEFGGYFRAGPGQKQDTSAKADALRCFNGSTTNGHGGIGRLGNECHTYGELALSHTAELNGVKYKALWMPNFYSGGTVDTGGSDPGGLKVTAVQQLYVEGKGFDIAPGQTFWVGKRFYHRADVHFDDAFFVNMSGMGVGIDGVAVGGASLSLAAFRTDDNKANPLSRVNVDLEGLDVNPGGKLRVTLAFTSASGAGGESGTGISLQHNQSGIAGGLDNTLWLQHAQGSASVSMNFGNATDDSKTKTTLLADALAWTTGPLTGQGLIQFGKSRSPAGDRSFSSIAGRVAYALSKNFKLQGELGTSNSKPQGGKNQQVTKFTLAPTLSVGPNYYDRPELRLYASHFRFNDAYKAANGLTKSSKTAVGAQVEIWF